MSKQPPIDSNLIRSIGYLLGLDLAHWARRNRVTPPWWVLSWLGVIVAFPLVVGVGALLIGAGYLMGGLVQSLSAHTANGLGLITATAAITALGGIFTASRRSRITRITLPADGPHLAAIGLHPWALLFQRGLVAVIGRAIVRIVVAVLVLLGCAIASHRSPVHAVLLLVSLGVAEVGVGLSILLGRLCARGSISLRFRTIMEIALNLIILVASFFTADWLLETARLNTLSEDATTTVVLTIDMFMEKQQVPLLLLCVFVGLAATAIVVWNLATMTRQPYTFPGSMRLCPAKATSRTRSFKPRSVRGALIGVSLRDRSRSASLWRLQSLFALRGGTALVGAVLGLDIVGKSLLNHWGRTGLAGGVVTIALILAISQISAQSSTVWQAPLRWWVDMGLPRRAAVLDYVGATLLLVFTPILPLLVAVVGLVGDFFLAVALVTGCISVIAGVLLADLIDDAGTIHADGTTEPGLLGGVISGAIMVLITGLLVVSGFVSAVLISVIASIIVTFAAVLMARRLMARRPR